MKKLVSLLILCSLVFSMLVPVLAQQPVQPAPDDVVRISTNLVQVDALVTDKDGNPIKDLRVGDFEVLQDGKPQKVVSVTYVDTEPLAQPDTPKKTDKGLPIAPPARTRSQNLARVLTFVVDDGNCTASRIGMTAAKTIWLLSTKQRAEAAPCSNLLQTKRNCCVWPRRFVGRCRAERAATTLTATFLTPRG
jgi:hypothetical protein